MMSELKSELKSKSLKTLVLYVFHIYNDRVKNFIEKCIFEDNNTDFILICNNKNIIINNNKINVKVLFRENIGYDFGGWSEALLTNNLYEQYDNFIFVNSSVIGPYVPSYYKNKWTDIYLDGLKDNVKLFGSTINTIKQPLIHAHVQSYIFSMDKNTLKFLIDCEIFSITNYAKSFIDAVYNKEVLMSRKIIENNWNIGSLLPYYANVDFTFKSKSVEECNIKFLDDVMYPPYKNIIWNNYDLVFIKGNRIKY
jgi:hypothetical protein